MNDKGMRKEREKDERIRKIRVWAEMENLERK